MRESYVVELVVDGKPNGVFFLRNNTVGSFLSLDGSGVYTSFQAAQFAARRAMTQFTGVVARVVAI